MLGALLKLVENDGTESPVRLKILTLKLYDKEEHGFEQSSKNAEISFRDCTLSVHSEDKKDVDTIVVRFVSSTERSIKNMFHHFIMQCARLYYF